ncbi:MAG: NAD(P)H-dependent oxidoreductase [Gammaproteobacteria bacterium]|nr:NAD(P)H-dependent oxidoreductase [Gammaproteobacteria bacterium]MCW5582598.1 NAD(P)H-dependent oxidoreductase [Gammaproteobacteria bacterium]
MNILYVYAHPNPSSFNGVLKQHALDLFTVLKPNIKFSDLYADHFKAIADWDDFNLDGAEINSQYFLAQQDAYKNQTLSIDIITELDKIAWADHIIFQFPLWWFSTPAILKGWLDRILVKGFAYDSGKVFNDGLLKGKTSSLIVTTQSLESAYQINGVHKATIDVFLHHVHHTLHFVGIKTLAPFIIYAAFNLDTVQKEKIVKNYLSYLRKLVEGYDELKS